LPRWNGDPWDVGPAQNLEPDSDGAPKPAGEEDPGPFLLAYWMARFHGLVE